jgi:hypothetical protein
VLLLPLFFFPQLLSLPPPSPTIFSPPPMFPSNVDPRGSPDQYLSHPTVMYRDHGLFLPPGTGLLTPADPNNVGKQPAPPENSAVSHAQDPTMMYPTSVVRCLVPVIALAVSPHSFPFIRLQHAQLNNDPYLSFLKPSHEITRQEDEHKTRQ